MANKYKAKVLVAEDYSINQEITKEMLELLDCTVDLAENGIEAVDKFKNNTYDLIFMDIQMPEMDGVEATQKIRELAHGKNIPIIALTANSLEGNKEKYLQKGMTDYVSKPVKLKDIEAVLQKFLKK